MTQSTKAKRRTTLMLLGLCVAACGCGDAASQSPPGDGPTVAKATIVERGDAICRRNAERFPGEPVQFDLKRLRPEHLSRFVRTFRNASLAIRASVREVRALGTPDRDANMLEDLLSEGTKAADAYAAMAQTSAAGDVTGFKAAFARLEENRSTEMAKRFGFLACAQV